MMTGPSFKQELLSENLRCKIIYYSCINPHTVAEMNDAWGYSSPTYLYQNDSIERLEETGMISVSEDGGKNIIRSKYDVLFEDSLVRDRQASINRDILQEYLLHSKGFHTTASDGMDLETLLDMGHENLDEGMQDDVEHLQFDADEFRTLLVLWKNQVFKEIFLSLDITVKIAGDNKSRLPENPLDHMFRITAGLMTSISRGRGENQELRVPQDLRYRAEKIIVPAYRKLENHQEHSAYEGFVKAMKDTYAMFGSKFRPERFNYDFIDDFIGLTIREESEKKLGRLLDKYRGDSGIF